MTDLDHIDRIRRTKAKTWIMSAEPCSIQSRIDWQIREVPAGTRARIERHGGGTWAQLTTGEPIVIETHDLAKWDIAQC